MKIITSKNATVRTRGDSATILDYNFKTDVFDIVVAIIDGSLGHIRNIKTTRTYYVISGSGAFEKDGIKHNVSEGDLIVIEPSEWTTIYGNNLKIAYTFRVGRL